MATTARRSYRFYLAICVIGVLICTGCPGLLSYWFFGKVRTVAEPQASPPHPKDELVDDRLEDQTPPPFDPDLVDRRLLGSWTVNQSAAVIRLDVTPVDVEREADLLTLRPSYAAAARAAQGVADRPLLLSVNLLDGKAKQFDDGLYAALEQAYYQGQGDRLRSHVDLVKRLYQKVGPRSEAAPFLAAGLELAGVRVKVADRSRKAAWLRDFHANAVDARPIGFYTWNETLARCFRFLRFFQQEFGPGDLAVPVALAGVLAREPVLLADYRKAVGFYARLTNPTLCLSLADLPGGRVDEERFRQLCLERRVFHECVALFPPSTSREAVLFEKLFPLGLPPKANLMRELIHRIRSGEVDLRPGPDSGWYDHQVYALETLLLPEKGGEHNKLLLTRAYKKRMLEAFKALMTKRRETHYRSLPGIGCKKKARLKGAEEPITPRLRIEPCPSFYLRTARAYAFLGNFLASVIGEETLRSLHGLRPGSQREQDLHAELRFMRNLFYGLYLVSAEDIGLRPAFARGEAVDRKDCYRTATAWLPTARDDQDLAADTRVSVPIFVDTSRGVTRIWATLGVRLAKLDASFVRPPRIRPVEGKKWETVKRSDLGPAHYLIPVDEFAEVELSGIKALTRDEFRAICDRAKSKEAIVAALQGRPAEGTIVPSRWRIWVGVVALVVVAVLTYFVMRRIRARRR